MEDIDKVLFGNLENTENTEGFLNIDFTDDEIRTQDKNVIENTTIVETSKSTDVPSSEINNENDTNLHDSMVEIENTEEIEHDKDHKMKLTKLPIGRVKNIIKSDSSINLINQEAVFLITMATELFIDSLAKESYKYTHQAKKKTIQKNDIQSAISNAEALLFLDGIPLDKII
ncbi:unnamed protein product [Trichogramma brassicae]|uniref:Transcription factor CBF/NF-Y/archaeal histone domain-containing protein n=1 Tax=Trichogramma brassicae TaxID=86971 RepID=A0A6H5IAN9_9HYME|nr:unnamed protein product [Trichogramma brassicae]